MVGYAGAAAFGRIARPRLAASGRNPVGGPWAAAAVVEVSPVGAGPRGPTRSWSSTTLLTTWRRPRDLTGN